MLVVDTHAEDKLTERLDSSSVELLRRCIYINAAKHIKEQDPIKLAMLDQEISAIIPPTPTEIYICKDHDLFIFSPLIREATKTSLIAIYHDYGIMIEDRDMMLWDLSISMSQVTHLAQVKLKQYNELKHQDSVQNKIRQKELLEQFILESQFDERIAENIEAKRNAHSQTEVLIVDDDIFSGSLVKNALVKEYSVSCAKDGVSAISSYAQKAPHTVFLDINLPDISGHKLIKKFKELDPNTYIIMLSGHGDKANVMRAVQEGAHGFIAKPFNKQKLVEYIQQCPTIQ